MRRKKNRTDIFCLALLGLFVLLITALPVSADNHNILPADSLLPPNDSTISPPAAPDTVIIDPVLYKVLPDSSIIKAYLTKNSIDIPKRATTKTMFKSVVFPGWGQLANRKYFKAGLFFIVESYFIHQAVDYGIKASDTRNEWKSLPDSLASAKAAAFRVYADNRDNRNTNIWYTFITIFFSMIDAYVDAHLLDFPEPAKEPDKLSFDLIPGEENRFELVYRF